MAGSRIKCRGVVVEATCKTACKYERHGNWWSRDLWLKQNEDNNWTNQRSYLREERWRKSSRVGIRRGKCHQQGAVGTRRPRWPRGGIPRTRPWLAALSMLPHREERAEDEVKICLTQRYTCATNNEMQLCVSHRNARACDYVCVLSSERPGVTDLFKPEATSWATSLLKSPEITHFLSRPRVTQDDWRYWSTWANWCSWVINHDLTRLDDTEFRCSSKSCVLMWTLGVSLCPWVPCRWPPALEPLLQASSS